MVRTKHRIGRYRVIAPIGAGGFATVYRALDESNGHEVAIKVLAENHSLVPDTRRRFVDEVGLLQTVDSQAIAKIYEVGETDTGQPYMVLELADRGDLRRRLEEIRGSHQVLNRADLTMLAHHLYDSLTTLHRAEIVHRDVSPGNILIRSRRAPGQRADTRNGDITLLEPGERFLLADLGHAKDMILASGFTAGGGTRGFASPEQRDDITVVDLRADIFSATAILEWAAHDGEFAEVLEPFFDIGLAADPEDRFTSMTEWHTAFSAALGASGSGTGKGLLSFEGLTGYLSEIPKRADRRSLTIAAAAVVLGGVVAYGIIRQGVGDSTVAGTAAEAEGSLIGAEAATEGAREALEVLSSDDGLGTTPGGPSSSNIVAEETTTTAPTTTEQPTTSATVSSTVSQPETTVTAPSTTAQTTTTEPSTTTEEPTVSLTAGLDSPGDGETVDGDLEITGTASFPDEVGTVELVVRNLDTNLHWNPETGRFEESFLRFPLQVDGNNDATTWSHTIPDDLIDSGLYRIGVWARAADGRGAPMSDIHTVFVL